MEINSLYEFTVLADVGNYLEASEQLFISQSTLSRHMKSLERELGSALFDTSSNSIRLTPYGTILLPYARQLYSLQAQCQNDFNRQKISEQNLLRISAFRGIVPYNLLSVFGLFFRKYPNISLNFQDLNDEDLIEHLKRRECDFAIMWQTDDPDLIQIPLITDTTVALVSHKFQLSGDSLTLEDLSHFQLILPDKSSFLYRLYTEAFSSRSISPGIYSCVERETTMTALASGNMGIALMMRRAAEYYAKENVSIVPIAPAIEARLCLTYLTTAKLKKNHSTFLSFMQSQFPEGNG